MSKNTTSFVSTKHGRVPNQAAAYYNDSLLPHSILPVLTSIEILSLSLFKILISNNSHLFRYITTTVNNIIYLNTSEIIPQMDCNVYPLCFIVCAIVKETVSSKLKHGCKSRLI
jgi:hypothetical protein